jgi:hypothetical protein
VLSSGQNPDRSRQIAGELEMTFPSIYFKHNSTDYAAMPYSVDSCFRYIAFNFDRSINNLVIWRDSLEPEELTKIRIEKLKKDLGRYNVKSKIHSMGPMQKISRRTINKSSDSLMISYLLSLNSVLDVSKIKKAKKRNSKDHIQHPSIFCGNCWATGFHTRIRRQLRIIEKQNKAKEKKEQEKRMLMENLNKK